MTHRGRTVGLLVDWLEYEYQNKILAGVDEGVRARGGHLMVFTGGVLASPYRFGERRNFIYDLAGPSSLDGIVIMSGPLGNYTGSKRLAQYCERYRPLPMSSIGVALDGIPSVLVDNATGMRGALRHLIRHHGLRRIAFLRGPGVNEEAEERYRVYRSALSEHGLPFNPELVTLGNFQHASGIEAVRVMLDERHVEFDALVAANDFMALGAMEALHARGIRIPQDVALVGFDDIKEGRFGLSPLTTVRQPLAEQGALGAQIVFELLEGRSSEDRVVLNTELVPRQSCGCASHAVPDIASFEEEDVARLLEKRRSAILGDIQVAVRRASSEIDTSYATQLLDAFVQALEDHSNERFFEALQDILLQVAAVGNVDAWQSAVTVLRAHLLPTLQHDPVRHSRAEDLLHTARAVVASAAERAQARQRLDVEQWSLTLRKVGETLFAMLDVHSVAHAVAMQLPKLRIRSAFMVLYEGGASPAERQRRIVLSCDADAGGPRHADEVFPPHLLIPPGHLPGHRRYTYVVEPLLFEREQLGYLLLEMGPRVGVVYETLRDQISSALRGALLVQQVVDETARRQMAERDQLQSEIHVAATLQSSILPKNLNVDGLEIAAVMLPAGTVGSDYYDVLVCDDGCWLGIGDVAGKGLQTSLMMMMIQSVVAAIVRHRPETRPSEVLRVLNAVLFENVRERLHRDERATSTLLRYVRSGRVMFAGVQGNIMVYRAAEGRCDLMTSPGAWLTADTNPRATIVDATFHLSDGDVMVLCTDGVVNSRDAEGQQSGTDRLCDLLKRTATAAVDQIRDQLVDAIRGSAAERDDDVALVVARFHTS